MILEFKGEYEAFSNFYPCRVALDNLYYRSVEHAFQAAKTLDNTKRTYIAEGSAGQAKRRGRLIKPLREDWSRVKVLVMKDLLIQKFIQEPFRSLLRATNGKYISEGNYWHDNFWGNCLCDECQNVEGQNVLGKLLMEIRDL